MRFFIKSNAPLSEQEIREWLIELRANAYTPASQYNVASVFRVKHNGDDTYYFAGVNVENPHHRSTIHAEEVCIAAMVTAFGKNVEIVEGWIMGAPKSLKPGDKDPLADNACTPCGKCRQQIAGFSDPSVLMHGLTLNGQQQSHQVGELLPKAFSYKNFLSEAIKQSSPNVVDSEAGFTARHSVESRLIRQCGVHPLSIGEIHQWLRQLESVDYASKTSQVAILRLADNDYVAGVTIEEAAFLSVDPIQCAMGIAHVAFGSVCVEEVWVLSKQNQDKNNNSNTHPLSVFNAEAMRLFPQFMGFRKASKEKSSQEEEFVPLSLAAIQVLAQFAKNDQITIHTFNASGTHIASTLQESTQLIPVFRRLDNPIKHYSRL